MKVVPSTEIVSGSPKTVSPVEVTSTPNSNEQEVEVVPSKTPSAAPTIEY
jgi:hypothetical protein